MVTTTRGCSRGGGRSGAGRRPGVRPRGEPVEPRRVVLQAAELVGPNGGVGERDGPGWGHVSRRRDEFHQGARRAGRCEGCRTTTSRTFEAVRATRAMRPARPVAPCGEPARRPCGSCSPATGEGMSHVDHSPGGSSPQAPVHEERSASAGEAADERAPTLRIVQGEQRRDEPVAASWGRCPPAGGASRPRASSTSTCAATSCRLSCRVLPVHRSTSSARRPSSRWPSSRGRGARSHQPRRDRAPPRTLPVRRRGCGGARRRCTRGPREASRSSYPTGTPAAFAQARRGGAHEASAAIVAASWG